MGRLLGCLGCGGGLAMILALALLAQGIANVGFGVAQAELGATVLTQTLTTPLYFICGAGIGLLLAVPLAIAGYITWRVKHPKALPAEWEALPGSERKPELPTAAGAKTLPAAPERVRVQHRRPARRTITIPRDF